MLSRELGVDSLLLFIAEIAGPLCRHQYANGPQADFRGRKCTGLLGFESSHQALLERSAEWAVEPEIGELLSPPAPKAESLQGDLIRAIGDSIFNLQTLSHQSSFIERSGD